MVRAKPRYSLEVVIPVLRLPAPFHSPLLRPDQGYFVDKAIDDAAFILERIDKKWPTSLRAETIQHISKHGKYREVKGGVGCDGNAQEPAKRPRHRFMSFRRNEFGEFQAGGEKSDQGSSDSRLDGYGNRQCEKACGQAQSCQ